MTYMYPTEKTYTITWRRSTPYWQRKIEVAVLTIRTNIIFTDRLLRQIGASNPFSRTTHLEHRDPLVRTVEPLDGDIRQTKEELGSGNEEQTRIPVQECRRSRVPPFGETMSGFERGLGLQKRRRLIREGVSW